MNSNSTTNYRNSVTDSADNGICTAVLSGGINRRIRARSEKRELGDSFANPAALHNNDNYRWADNEDTSSRLCKNLFLNRKKTFENCIANDGNSRLPLPSTQIPYGGNKTSSTSPNILKRISESHNSNPPCSATKNLPDEWDFLAKLNDILRKEKYLIGDGDEYCNTTTTPTNSAASSFSRNDSNNGSSSNSESNDPNFWSANVSNPMSPRPPRPLRRTERRKDCTKARSMDVGHFADLGDMISTGYYNSASPQMAQNPSTIQRRCISPYQTQPSPTLMTNCNRLPPIAQRGNVEPKTLKQFPTNNFGLRNNMLSVGTPLNISPLLNTMSSSLDSIYDRLKSTESRDPIGPSVPFTHLRRDGAFNPVLINNTGAGYYSNEFPCRSPVNNSFSNICSGYGSENMNPNLTCIPNNDGKAFYGGDNSYRYQDAYSHQPQRYQVNQRPYYASSANNVSIGSDFWPNENYNRNFENSTWRNNDFRSRSCGSLKGSLVGLDYEDRLLRLESDKDTLHLQVSVLSDQIEAQTSKIQDLEKLLDDKRNVLESTEDQLQRELLTRSSLETQKLELMTEISSLRLKHASLERENMELKDRFDCKSIGDLTYIDGGNSIWDKPPTGLSGRTSPGKSCLDSSTNRGRLGSSSSDNGHLSMGQLPPARVKTPPANAYRRIDQSVFGTLPKARTPHSTQFTTFTGGITGHSAESGNHKSSKTNSLSSGNINVVSNYSSLTNTVTEREDWEKHTFTNVGSGKKQSPSGGHKSRGIMKILGKLRRSNSGGLDNDVAPESGGPFSRGGIRATAAPRLGWMREPSPLRKPEGPISTWNAEGVIMWLNYLGLGMYAGEVKRWVKTGQQMLDASVHELEKELGIKNPLHRKKLSLALHYLKNPGEEDNAGKLDYHWVIRWLDDIGLPQYKELFGEARIDGRILSHLTTEDLLILKVSSVLHHASIKRGIQLLRIHRFHPGCLCRRGGPNSFSVNGNTNGSSGKNNGSSGESTSGSLWGPKNVATWTNHRVMEWLKAIDLAEYAPNLRGSGVHGALIILESRFNAELLATLLAIPGNKTLLRRHLSLQFNELVGRHIVQEKRTIEIAPEFVPIHPTTKIKAAKKAQFPLRKKRLSTEMTDELLCPIDLNSYPFNSDSTGQISCFENSVDGPNGDEKVSNI